MHNSHPNRFNRGKAQKLGDAAMAAGCPRIYLFQLVVITGISACLSVIFTDFLFNF